MLTYVQLVNLLEKTKEQLNEAKLNSLNLTKNNSSLKNKCDDLQRLLHCLSTNDIPRLNQILKTCLTQKMGINAIVELLENAINKIYKCKSYSKQEIDLGFLHQLMGGPRLVYALKGLIPSSSVLHRTLASGGFKVEFLIMKNILKRSKRIKQKF
jgi:hypothetical protein